MLNPIVEETLREFPGAPVNLQTFNDELCSARSHVLKLISRHLTDFGDKFPGEALSLIHI